MDSADRNINDPDPADNGESPPQTPELPEWCRVYDGLSDREITEVERIALDRSNFGRPSLVL